MEHLTRNTSNDRLIYTIESTKREDQSIIDKNFKELTDKIISVLTGLLSSIISASIISILKNEEKFHCNFVIILIIFLLFVIVFWFIGLKWVVPYFYKLFSRIRMDITPKSQKDAVRQFNTEIMQKVAEIMEIIEVIKKTKEVRCKTLNFVLSLYKLQEIVNFLYMNFASEKKVLRKSSDQGGTEVLRYSFNIYTVAAVLETVKYIEKEMKRLTQEDNEIKTLEGIELLRNDLSNIGKKLEKIKIPY